MIYNVTTTARLLDGRQFKSCTETMTEAELNQLYEFMANVAQGDAGYVDLRTETGRIYLPRKLLKTTIFSVEVSPIGEA